jgi:photosystem II stability/assembly factor-like uncharacterized protein
MKQLFTLLMAAATILLGSQNVQAQCTPTEIFQDDLYEFELSGFRTATEFWGFGKAGKIVKATKSGNTWTATDLSSNANVGVIFTEDSEPAGFYANGNTMYVADEGMGLMKTTDAGATWSVRYSSFAEPALCVAFSSTNTNFGVVGTDGAGVYFTIDGGATWTQYNTDLEYTDNVTAASVVTSVVLNELNAIIFIGTEPGQVFQLDLANFDALPSAQSWSAMFNSTFESYFSSEAIKLDLGGGNLIAAGGNSDDQTKSIVKYSGSGTTWTYFTIADFVEKAEGIAFVNINKGYAIDNGGNFFLTTNGGTNWSKYELELDLNTMAIFPGTDNLIGLTGNEDGTFIIEQCFPTSTKSKNEVAQISAFPNPAENQMTIETAFAGTLTILDAQGLIIATQEVVEGANELSLVGMSAGLYLLNVQGDNASAQHTIIVK